LPLIPSYLAMLAGTTVSAIRDAEATARRRVLLRSLAFVAGFSLVFILLGLALSRATAMIGGTSRIVSLIAGVAVIFLGLNVAFDFVKMLNIERRVRLTRRPDGIASAVLFGAAFAAGWSPCVGPMLASILFLAGRGSTLNAAFLLSAYSLGLALPFLAAGAFFGRLEGVFAFFKKRMRAIKLVSGALLVAIGVSMLVGDFGLLPGLFAKWGYALESASGAKAVVAKWVFTAIYGASATIAALLGWKTASAIGATKRIFAIGLMVVFGALAILEATGVLNSAAVVAAWLRFQGI
jgi:cytochrome c-type biogenesis protein